MLGKSKRGEAGARIGWRTSITFDEVREGYGRCYVNATRRCVVISGIVALDVDTWMYIDTELHKTWKNLEIVLSG